MSNTAANKLSGLQGPAGINGVNGARGSLWYSGTGSPGTIAGQQNNDFYIDTATANYYELISGTWTLLGTLGGSTAKYARMINNNCQAITFSPNITTLNGLTSWAFCGWTYTRLTGDTGPTIANQAAFHLSGGGGTAYFYATPAVGGTVFFNLSGWSSSANFWGWMFWAISVSSSSVTAYYKNLAAASLTTGATGSVGALINSTGGFNAPATTGAAYDIHDVQIFSQALTSANLLSIAADPSQAATIAGANLKFWAKFDGHDPEVDSSGNGYSSQTGLDKGLAVLSM